MSIVAGWIELSALHSNFLGATQWVCGITALSEEQRKQANDRKTQLTQQVPSGLPQVERRQNECCRKNIGIEQPAEEEERREKGYVDRSMDKGDLFDGAEVVRAPRWHAQVQQYAICYYNG